MFVGNVFDRFLMMLIRSVVYKNIQPAKFLYGLFDNIPFPPYLFV